jgi:hypothetical protein
MKSPRILMFAPLFFPLSNPEAIVNEKLASAGLHSGWCLDVITEANDDNWYPQRDVVGYHNPVEAIIHPISTPKNGSLKDLYLRVKSKTSLFTLSPLFGNSWSKPAKSMARILIKRNNKYDYILSRSNPDYAHLPALIISKEFNIPWIVNWNDPVPAYTAPPPYGRGPAIVASGPPIIRHLKRICLINYYRTMAMQADWHTFPCERLRRYMLLFLGDIVRNKSSVIPHIALNNRIDGCDNNLAAINDEFTLCFAGSLRKPRSADAFLNGVKLFIETTTPKRKIQVKFFLGHEIDDIMKTVEYLGMKDIVTIGEPFPYDLTTEKLKKETILVIIETPVKEGIFLPSKFVDYITVGRPILAVSPKEGTIADYLNQYGGGIATDCTSSHDVARGICRLYDAWERNELNTKFQSKKLFPLFSEDLIIQQYHDLFDLLSS